MFVNVIITFKVKILYPFGVVFFDPPGFTEFQ